MRLFLAPVLVILLALPSALGAGATASGAIARPGSNLAAPPQDTLGQFTGPAYGVGNTRIVTYDLELQMTLSYAINGGGSPPSGPWVYCLQLGSPTNTSLTTSPALYPCDYGTTWTVGHNPLGSGGSPGTQRWYTGQTLTGTDSGQTLVFTFYNQLLNTYTATPQTPSSWDAYYNWQINGTSLGVPASLQTCNTTVPGGSTTTCNVSGNWYDYDTAVSEPAEIGNTWAAQAPSSFTDTTGANTHNVNYTQSAGGNQGLQFSTLLIAGMVAVFMVMGVYVARRN